MLSELKRALYLGLMASIFALLLGVSLGRAEPPGEKANWNNLKNLLSGQEVQVVLTDAKSFQGRFQSVSDEALTVRLASGNKSFGRQTVLRVSSKGQSHRLRNTALGAGVGFGAGAAIGAAAGNPSAIGGRGTTALVGAAIGLATGAVTGAALPSGGWHDVYRAR